MIFDELPSGTSASGHEIEAYKTPDKAKRYLYLIGGTHGDEVEGVYVLKQLFHWLENEHNMHDLPMIVVPILNIDGYHASTRVNARGVDLNRNYPASSWHDHAYANKNKYNPGTKPLSEPENEFLEKLFRKYPPGFVLSFHSWKPILNFNGDAKDVAEFLANFNQYPMCDDIGYPTPGSLGTYVPEAFGAGVLTFECPLLSEGYTLKGIWEENEKGLKELIISDLLLDKLARFKK